MLFCFICGQDEPLRGTAETGQKSMQCSLVYNITGFRHRRGPATGDALHRNHWLWCQTQGGGKRRSGATSIDDNAVDDSIAGEADRRSSPAAGFTRICASQSSFKCSSLLSKARYRPLGYSTSGRMCCFVLYADRMNHWRGTAETIIWNKLPYIEN